MRLALVVLACVACGTKHADDALQDDALAYYHGVTDKLGQLEDALGSDLADQPMRCGSVENAFRDATFARVQSSLRTLAHDGLFAGATVAIACGERSLVVATAGARTTAFTGVGTRLDNRELSWGTFPSLPPPSRGLTVESELPLAHERARVTWLFELP